MGEPGVDIRMGSDAATGGYGLGNGNPQNRAPAADSPGGADARPSPLPERTWRTKLRASARGARTNRPLDGTRAHLGSRGNTLTQGEREAGVSHCHDSCRLFLVAPRARNSAMLSASSRTCGTLIKSGPAQERTWNCGRTGHGKRTRTHSGYGRRAGTPNG